MKTKQTNIRAKFTKERDNARNYSREKELDTHYVITDKKTEKVVVDCRIYVGRSRNASTVYASIWINLSDKKKPEYWAHASTSGTGSAGGWGYHKGSAAVSDALTSGGIELYGTAYACRDEKIDFKNRAYIHGVGDTAIESALLAVAHAAGFNDVIFSH